MLTYKKLLRKMELIEKRYYNLMFDNIAEINMEMLETYEHFRKEPKIKNAKWKPVKIGKKWGEKWLTVWFRGDVKIPSALANKKLFVNAKIETEGLFLVDGDYKGNFDNNHRVVLMTPSAKKIKIIASLSKLIQAAFCRKCLKLLMPIGNIRVKIAELLAGAFFPFSEKMLSRLFLIYTFYYSLQKSLAIILSEKVKFFAR